jgi:hypothetical protein
MTTKQFLRNIMKKKQKPTMNTIELSEQNDDYLEDTMKGKIYQTPKEGWIKYSQKVKSKQKISYNLGFLP